MNTKVMDTLFKVIKFILLIIGAVIMVLPFYWMIMSSVKPNADVLHMPPVWFPVRFSLENYVGAFEKFSVFRYYLNSLIVVGTVTVLTIFLSALIGFVFGKFEFKGRNLIFFAILATMMVPFEVRMLPLYKLAIGLGLRDTYLGLMFLSLTSTFGIYFLRQHMHSIPNDLLDSACIDGCNNMQKYWHVILPLSKQVLSALAIFTFMWNWDEFLWPLLITNKTEMRTIQLGLATFINEYGVKYGVFMASATLSSIPVIIVFMFFQKQIVKGVAMTGIK